MSDKNSQKYGQVITSNRKLLKHERSGPGDPPKKWHHCGTYDDVKKFGRSAFVKSKSSFGWFYDRLNCSTAMLHLPLWPVSAIDSIITQFSRIYMSVVHSSSVPFLPCALTAQHEGRAECTSECKDFCVCSRPWKSLQDVHRFVTRVAKGDVSK